MSAGPLPNSIPCKKCGGRIIILGRTGGGAIAVSHQCKPQKPQAPKDSK